MDYANMKFEYTKRMFVTSFFLFVILDGHWQAIKWTKLQQNEQKTTRRSKAIQQKTLNK